MTKFTVLRPFLWAEMDMNEKKGVMQMTKQSLSQCRTYSKTNLALLHLAL